MNNISKYFDKSSKKIDLSRESNPEEERNKVREGSSKSNDKWYDVNDTIDDEVCQQSNSTSDISEILVSSGKIEAKVAEIYNFCKEAKSMQIRGDKQLAELTE